MAVQILFSNRALLRFLYAFKASRIDAGVLIVDSKNKLGRMATDLIGLRSTLTRLRFTPTRQAVPLWVIALK